MNNKILKIGLLIVAMCFVIGCEKDDDEPKTSNPLIGSWEFTADTTMDNNVYSVILCWTFNSDGTNSAFSEEKLNGIIINTNTELAIYKYDNAKFWFYDYYDGTDNETHYYYKIGTDSKGKYLMISKKNGEPNEYMDLKLYKK